MAEPIRLQVLKALQAQLQGITGSGYNYPVTTPESVTIDPTTNLLTSNDVDVPFYVIEPTDSTRDYFPASQVLEDIRGTITGRMDISDLADPTARAATWENMAADIEKAICIDVTLGGLVYDVKLDPPSPFIGVGSPIVLVVQPWVARVHRFYGQP